MIRERDGRLVVGVVNRVAAIWPQADAVEPARTRQSGIARTIAIPLVLLSALSLLLRVYVARNQPLFVDEAFSLLAIQAVGERGLLLLPTGTPYLHGATLSYLLAPLAWLGFAEPEYLFTMRMVSAVAGAVSVVLAFRLAQLVGASGMTSLFAAALLAADPASVEWGGYLRMYALAQTLALVVALLFIKTISEPSGNDAADGRRHLTLIGLVLVFWLDIFTHLATALLWPAMALIAAFIYGKSLFRARRDVSAVLLACLAAPATLIALNGIAGLGAGTRIIGEAEGLPGISFLGDDKIQFKQVLHPDPAVWTSLFGPGPLENLMPLLATVATGLLVATLVFLPAGPRRSPGMVPGIPALLALYWIPVVLFAFLAGDTSTRYGLFLIPFGSVLTAVALQVVATLSNAKTREANSRFPAGAALSLVLAAVMLLHGIAGIAETISLAASGRRDLVPALRYVRAERAPDETVFTVIPPPMTAIVLGDAESLVFLPGGERSLRARRYIRVADDGQTIDYWLGVPALTTSEAMCTALADSPRSWLVVSKGHWQKWGFSGGSNSRARRRASELQDVITGSSELVFEDRQGRVFRINPTAAWSDTAQGFCDRATKRASRGSESPD